MNDSERRHLPRVAVNFAARLDIILPEAMRRRVVLETRVLDLSEAGCQLLVQLSDSLHQLLTSNRCEGSIDFKGKPGLPMRLFARQIWVESKPPPAEVHAYHIGLYFQDRSERDAQMIRSFLEHAELLFDLDET